MRRGFEISVGVFVAAAALFLAVMIFMSGNYRMIGGDNYTLRIGFRDVSGLKPDAPVFIAGNQMGLVKEINFHEPKTINGKDTYFVTLTLLLPGSVDLRKGTRAFVSSQGFLGEMSVGLEPGYMNERIENNAFIRGREMVSFADVQQSADETLRTVNDVVGSFRGFSNIANDREFTENLRSTVLNAKAITVEIRDLLVENRTDISRAVKNSTKNIEEGSYDFRRMAADWRESSGILLTEVEKLVNRTERIVGSGGDSVLYGIENFRAASGDFRIAGEDFKAVSSVARRVSEQKETDLLEIVSNAKIVSDELKTASGNLRIIISDLENGRGALGVALRDTSAEIDMKMLLNNLDKASARLEELLSDVKQDPDRYLKNLNLKFSVFGSDRNSGSRRERVGSSY